MYQLANLFYPILKPVPFFVEVVAAFLVVVFVVVVVAGCETFPYSAFTLGIAFCSSLMRLVLLGWVLMKGAGLAPPLAASIFCHSVMAASAS
jgi:hypothetical protein